MDLAVAFVVLAGVNLMGAISPGPSFVVQARLSAAHSRRAGVFSAFGMGLGAVVWAALSMLGFAILMREAAELYTALRLAGGAYLVYLGVMLWRQAKVPLAEISVVPGGAVSGVGALRVGLFTALSNPKMAAFFASVYMTVLPPDPPLWFKIAACGAAFAVEMIWYTVVALAFSTGAARRAYGRFKVWIDRAAGGVIAALGVGIMVPGR